MYKRFLVPVVGALALASWAPTAASAAAPERPSGEHVIAATSSSFTVTANRGANATSYRLYASTSKAAVYAVNINSHTKSAGAAGPTITLRGLAYTASPYFYRLKSMHGNSYRWGPIALAGLKPARPTGVKVSSTASGTKVTWNSQASGGFAVTRATNNAMTQNRVSTIVYSHYHQFSPTGLARGTKYYFSVRARNHGTYSSYSNRVSVTAQTAQQTVRIATYNILMASTAGTKSPEGVYASWGSRRAGVAKLIKESKADVVAVQEASNWVGKVQGYGGKRQVDDLVSELPGFTVALSETPPTQHGYRRYGVYILYRTSAYQSGGARGVWTLDTGHFAAYQVLQNRTSGARFLFVSTHLIVGHSAALDAQRKRQSATLISDARKLGTSLHVPVVFGGDFNSAVGAGYATDTPSNAMRAENIVDARSVALKRYSESLNSANQYERTPPAHGHDIDYVFAGPGAGVKAWGVLADLVNHKFVGVIPSDHDPVWADVTIPV